MRSCRAFLLVCALGFLLAYGQAQAQSAPKPGGFTCGSWQQVPSPNPNENGILTAVASVPGSTEVWSVGYYNANYHWLTLIERWDGTSWQVVPSPNHAGSDHILHGVTALAPDDAWAVGSYDPPGGGTNTLILHWDGLSWSIVPSPNSTVYNQLWAVAAESPQSVWAVGHHLVTTPPILGQQTLIEHWNGTSWSSMPSPNVGTHDNLLKSVTVVRDPSARLLPSPIWAAGYYYRDAGPPSTLSLRWDGTAWVVVPSPDGSTRENYLTGISGSGRNDIWAVGIYNRPDGLYLPLSVHWNGASWQTVPALSISSSLTALTSVAAVSATDVWAVGYYYNDISARLTLAQHWYGTGWQITPSPSPAGEGEHEFNSLESMVSVPGWGCGR